MREPLIMLITLAIASTAAAQVAGVGSTLSPRIFEDQHGEEHALDESLRLVVFARDMDAGDLVKEALAETTGEQLSKRGIAYVSDISGMPKLVARLFALPAMRKRAYPMWLDRDGTSSSDLPAEASHVTLLHLERLRVTAVEYFDATPSLRTALGVEPGAEGPAREDP